MFIMEMSSMNVARLVIPVLGAMFFLVTDGLPDDRQHHEAEEGKLFQAHFDLGKPAPPREPDGIIFEHRFILVCLVLLGVASRQRWSKALAPWKSC